MRSRYLGAGVLVAGLLMSTFAPGAWAAVLTGESFSADYYLGKKHADVFYTDFYDLRLQEHWDRPLREFPELQLVISWRAPILSRTTYDSSDGPWSVYRVGSGRVKMRVFGPGGEIGTMSGPVDGVTFDVEDFNSDDDDPGGDPDGVWTETGGGALRLSRGLARYLGVARLSNGFSIDVLPDHQSTAPDDPVRNFRIGCCAFVYVDLTPATDGPDPVPEVAAPALATLGIAAAGWIRHRRRR